LLLRSAHLLPPFCVLLLLLPCRLAAEELPAISSELVLKSGTQVKLQVAQTISSAHANKNDRLSFVVLDDVDVQGLTVIRAGAIAEGSVVGVKGKRVLGLGGNLTINLDSVELPSGDRLQLTARQEFKGKSHTIRMAIRTAIAAAIYLPIAPVFLLSRGGDSTLLQGTEITAITKNDTVVAGYLPGAPSASSELDSMLNLLPPRAMNGEGRAGDMLNLIFSAKEEDLQRAFVSAGWLRVEQSKPQIVWHLLLQRTHYTKLPMDRLYVFGRSQDYSYALPDPTSIVARRHHLRIWKTDRTVDGVPLWVGAATEDVSIQFVKHRLELLHRIDPNVDAERDFIASNLQKTQQIARQLFVRRTQPVLAAQTATGQKYYSDGRMILLEWNQRELTTVATVTTAASTTIAAKQLE
jgi:hypothetical protein